MTDQQTIWPSFDDVLVQERTDLQTLYRKAAPYPHLVLDHLFPPSCLRAVAGDFEQTTQEFWQTIRSGLQNRKVSSPNAPLPATVQHYFNIVNSGPFTRFLSEVTGIADLIPDPALFGGGMHQAVGGGTFEVHVDFEQNPRTFLRNRLAVITYLNEEWTHEDGGALELWRLKPRQCMATVTPVFGRTVIIGQSKEAAHGHLQPIRDGRIRRSVTAYFYTNGTYPSLSTGLLPTSYFSRGGMSFRQKLEVMLRLVTPPLLLSGVRVVAQRFGGAAGKSG
jgi:hypothetical protein